MIIAIAPDAFKGSLTAHQVAEAMERGVKNADSDIETVLIPMSDGGEGTVQSLVDAVGGQIVTALVKGPLLQEVNAFYGILEGGKTAIIEMASASGLPLITEKERDPLKTTTYGTGQLIKDALDKGCRKLIIGLGGSATNDAGSGMIQALGARLLDKNGDDIGFGGSALEKLHRIDLSGFDLRIKDCNIYAACDVNNPLCGEEGASYVYGPQKGANKEIVNRLDSNLEWFAKLIKEQLGIEIKDLPGAGAAGGLGGGVVAFLNGELKKGIDIVVELTGLEKKIEGADLVITGEGMIDYQTAFGKTPFGVAETAKEQNIPVIAIAGSLGQDYQTLYQKGFDGIYSIINKPMSLEEAIRNGAKLVEEATESIIRTLKNYI
jgi:glycerate kinase